MVDSLKIEVELGRDEVQSQMYNIGVAGRQAFVGIAKAAAEFSVVLGTIGVALAAGAGKELLKFANAAEETEKALTQLQKVSGQTFENLSALATVFAQGGTELKKFASEFGNLSDKIAKAGEQAAQQDAIKKQAEDAAKGLKVTSDATITLDQRVKTLLEDLSRAAPEQQWLRLADVFKNLGNTIERARIGQALGLSPESIATLSRGSEAIKQMQAEAEKLGLTLTESNQQALEQMAQGWNQFTALLSAFFQKIGAIAAPALARLYESFSAVLQGIVSDFEKLPLDQALSNLGNRLTPVFEALLQVLTPIVSALGTALGNAIVNAIMDSIAQGIQNIKNKWGIGGAPAPGSPNFIGPTQPGFAAGGLLGGSGTGTSDSNLAWLSRGEYVTPARAVAQPGVLGFLEALRRSGGSLTAALNGMGRFALGGMVRGSIPAFAAGGLAGGSNVTIAFPGLPPIGGLRASSDVVEQLHRAAALAQVRSGGRKPSRYA